MYFKPHLWGVYHLNVFHCLGYWPVTSVRFQKFAKGTIQVVKLVYLAWSALTRIKNRLGKYFASSQSLVYAGHIYKTTNYVRGP